MEYDEDKLTWQKICELTRSEIGIEADYSVGHRVKASNKQPHFYHMKYFLSGDGLLTGSVFFAEDKTQYFRWKKLINLSKISVVTRPDIEKTERTFFASLFGSPNCAPKIRGEQFYASEDDPCQIPSGNPVFVLDYPRNNSDHSWTEMLRFSNLIKKRVLERQAYRNKE
jgi:hypothetical protein